MNNDEICTALTMFVYISDYTNHCLHSYFLFLLKCGARVSLSKKKNVWVRISFTF